MVEKRRMHGLAHGVVAAERKRDVTHSTRYLNQRHCFFYPSSGLDEVDGVAIVLLYSCCNRENVGIKDYVLRRKTNLFCQQLVGSLAN